MVLASSAMRSPTDREIEEGEDLESEVLCACRMALKAQRAVLGYGPRLITWERLQQDTKGDAGYQELVQSHSKDLADWPKGLQRIGQYKDQLS
jgi:hypothetical protein